MNAARKPATFGQIIGRRLRLPLVSALCAACFFLLYWFHFQRRSDIVFTHFFYIPIVLGALWWDWRGYAVALILTLALVVTHLLGGVEEALWPDLARSASFLTVGTAVAALSRRQRRLRGEIAARARDLEEAVEQRTRQLHEKNRELEAYAHTISHDLTAPLVVIQGYVELLQEKGHESLGEEGMAYLQSIEKAAERMRRMTRSLLDYARAGTSGGGETANTGEVLGEVLAERSLDLERGGVEVEVAGNLPRVRANPDRLQQVFANLLDNALKYRGDNPHPRIAVGWCPEGGMACFSFRDNGMGIDGRDLEEVFQPFRRLSNRGEPGLGIGLSTVKRLVEGWGGRVWVESSPGEGSTFYFTAPLCDAMDGGEE